MPFSLDRGEEYLLVRLELFVADGVTVLNDGIDKQGGAKPACVYSVACLQPFLS